MHLDAKVPNHMINREHHTLWHVCLRGKSAEHNEVTQQQSDAACALAILWTSETLIQSRCEALRDLKPSAHQVLGHLHAA